MSLVFLPPELRSICRKLTSTKTEQLPNVLPALLKDLQRCQVPLSEPHESKSTANSSEAAVLVHKLRTQISSLLNGRSLEGRFVAIALIKSYVDVGGWDTLRSSETWVNGLLSILQKRDPMAVKELCVVVLTKIYTLLHKYQTLIREIVTPTLPVFAKACLTILKPASTSKVAIKAPLSVTETIIEAFSILIPLYPTTLRPSVGQLRAATRPYLAPTSSDEELIPRSLQTSSRNLVTRLHMTAAKNGGADEWTKHFAALIKEFHETADQVFRAIYENWESPAGYTRQQTNFDAEASGGGSAPEQYPEWQGVQAGSERMVGLLGCLADSLRCATTVAVTIPISAVADLTTRVSLIIPPMNGKTKNEVAQLNPGVGREEKDDLWAVFPDVQVAALQLVRVLNQRLGRSFAPFAQETLEQAVRILDSGYRLPEIRSVVFALCTDLLQLCGPAMTKVQVDALQLVSMTCCRDLLGAAGHLKTPKPQTSTTTANGAKSKASTQNADAFLKSGTEDEFLTITLAAEHLASAEQLLAALFSYLPQQHITPDLRSRMLRTAIICQIKDAQVASILHPAKDKNGRTAQVILPYLHQQFPHDEAVEILRFNFRPMASSGGKGDLMDLEDDMEIDEEEPVEKPTNGFTFDRPFQIASTAVPSTTRATTADLVVARSAPPAPAIAAEIQPSPFLPQPGVPTVAGAKVTDIVPPAVVPVSLSSNSSIPLKRKSEEEAALASKRVGVDGVAANAPDPGFGAMGNLVEDTLATVSAAPPPAVAQNKVENMGVDDDSDDESVHLNMELDTDEEDEDE